MGTGFSTGTDSRIADIEGVGTKDFSWSSADLDEMALGLADNIGVKGSGVSGNSCETVGVTADRVCSP